MRKALIALLFAGLLGPVFAQDADDQQRGVARISLAEGQVSVRRGDSGDWVAAVMNAPLMSGDQIATGPNSRAEIQFDAANVLRMGGNADLRLMDLQAGRYQMQLGRGTVTYRVLRPSAANAEVDTPTVSVRPSKQGAYRIYVADSGDTRVMARSGEVEVFTPHGSQWVNAGQMMMARGTAADPEFQIVGAVPMDEWDQWCDSRDHMYLEARSPQYVPEGVYGAENLDQYGNWVNVPPYGNVWQPTGIDPGWAPYSAGRWGWEDWYGWNWISSEPWGWAPYHYGRWFWQAPWGWCWYPGAWGVRHWWSPALVGWFGFGGGGGFGFGFGFGNIGWVPLAPFEVFHPWWGRGFYGRGIYGRGLNITNVNVTNVYRNARIAGGISGMRAGDFQGGRFNAISHLSGSQVGQAGMIRGQLPVSPSSSHLNFANRGATYAPRNDLSGRQFFSRQQASPAQRIPFAQQRSALGAQSDPVARGGQSNPAAGGGGWRRFGEPGGGQNGVGQRQNALPQNNIAPRGESNGLQNRMENTRPPSASGGNGWQRFGSPGSSAAPPRYEAPRSYGGGSSRGFNNPAPSYSAPRSNNAPNSPRSYSAPAPHYSAPAPAPHSSAPSYSAPRSFGGGGGGGHPSGGGGGGHSSGGGGHSGGGGGHHR
jgi:hypothetical protein